MHRETFLYRERMNPIMKTRKKRWISRLFLFFLSCVVVLSVPLHTHLTVLSFNVRLAFPFRGEEFLEFHQENVSKSKKEKNVAQDYCSGLALASFVWVECVRFSLRSISRTCIEMKSSDKLRWMDGWRKITDPLPSSFRLTISQECSKTDTARFRNSSLFVTVSWLSNNFFSFSRLLLRKSRPTTM